MNLSSYMKLIAAVQYFYEKKDFKPQELYHGGDWYKFISIDTEIIYAKKVISYFDEKSQKDIYSFQLNDIDKTEDCKDIILFCDSNNPNYISGQAFMFAKKDIPSFKKTIVISRISNEYIIEGGINGENIKAKNINLGEKEIRKSLPNIRAREIYNNKKKDFRGVIGEMDFIKFYKDNYEFGCHYCGLKYEHLENESFHNKYGSIEKTNRAKLIFDEIDQKNPGEDYFLQNIVICCSWCNNAKSNYFSYEDFKNYGYKGIKEIWKEFFKNEKELFNLLFKTNKITL